MSKERAKIVSRKHLNKIGKEKNLQKHIKSNLKTLPEKIFGNTLEAIIGAIYVDKGMDRAREFIIKNIIVLTYIFILFHQLIPFLNIFQHPTKDHVLKSHLIFF